MDLLTFSFLFDTTEMIYVYTLWGRKEPRCLRLGKAAKFGGLSMSGASFIGGTLPLHHIGSLNRQILVCIH
jgi:hypothetical protein